VRGPVRPLAPKRKAAGGHGEENVERWLLTYADMITLLMAFFIMMYAMSILNLGKFSQLAVSVRSGFGGDDSGMMNSALGITDQTGSVPANSLQLLTQIAQDVRNALSQEGQTDVEFLSEGGVVTIRVRAEDVLFARGSARLTPQASRTLDAIAQAIAHLPYQVRVEGHTCDLPVHNAQFANNWELSAQRATEVVLYFIEHHGFSPRRMAAAGYADTVPVAANDTEANRAKNRRIDIVLLTSDRRINPSMPATAAPPQPGLSPQPVRLEPDFASPAPSNQGTSPLGDAP
jgi:chemotaxis protein MotB